VLIAEIEPARAVSPAHGVLSVACLPISPDQRVGLHGRTSTCTLRQEHSFLRRGCLAIPPRGATRSAKRGDRTRHLLRVIQPAHHLPCFAFVHRQGVEPCCADLSGPATSHVAVQGVNVRRSGVEPVCQIHKTRLLTGGRRKIRTAPRNRTELQCFVRACPAPAGERRVALGRGFEPR
jgi:hypothetical protein